MSFDTILRGGRAVTAADVVTADIAVSGGRIADIGHDFGQADETVDASDLIVMPGGTFLERGLPETVM